MLLPAEWEKQQAIWLTWPQNLETWSPVKKESEAAYREVIRAVLHYQDVILLVNEDDRRKILEDEFQDLASDSKFRLDILRYPTNDSWIRDYGGITVRAKNESAADAPTKLVTLDFNFNSWGGKYPPWDKDDAAPTFMAAHRSRELFQLDFVLEGGSIDVNGQGKLLTTKQCLLNPNRNPQYGQGQIEEVLHQYLGVQDFLWLETGIHGDDTDGHVDDLARFTDARTILCAIETDRTDENYNALKSNVEVLNKYSRTADLEVVEVPMPARQIKAGLRTPATYMNFLIINGAVLAPVFLDKRDDNAMQQLEHHFPGRKIIPIDCRSLVFGQGAIHCSSMQEPAA